MTEQTDWIHIASQGLPDFIKHGFHTGKLVDVRREDGTEETTIYQGQGLFGNGVSMFKPATHWRLTPPKGE